MDYEFGWMEQDCMACGSALEETGGQAYDDHTCEPEEEMSVDCVHGLGDGTCALCAPSVSWKVGDVDRVTGRQRQLREEREAWELWADQLDVRDTEMGGARADAVHVVSEVDRQMPAAEEFLRVTLLWASRSQEVDRSWAPLDTDWVDERMHRRELTGKYLILCAPGVAPSVERFGKDRFLGLYRSEYAAAGVMSVQEGPEEPESTVIEVTWEPEPPVRDRRISRHLARNQR